MEGTSGLPLSVAESRDVIIKSPSRGENFGGWFGGWIEKSPCIGSRFGLQIGWMSPFWRGPHAGGSYEERPWFPRPATGWCTVQYSMSGWHFPPHNNTVNTPDNTLPFRTRLTARGIMPPGEQLGEEKSPRTDGREEKGVLVVATT
jgi:hypothetical protein